MITDKQVEIYRTYKGDGDGFVRCALEEEKLFMNYEQWAQIDNFIHDIYLIRNGKSSQSFEDSVNEELKKKCDSQETIRLIFELEKYMNG